MALLEVCYNQTMGLDTLTISQMLQEAGFERKQAEAVAKVINKKNKELASKNETRLLFAGLYIAGAYGFVLLNTIIANIG